jgi:hypothetical protein
MRARLHHEPRTNMGRDTTLKRAMIERTAENDAVYRQIRSEIQFEINMMHARVNWLIASQAFLFVPLTIGAQGLRSPAARCSR